MSGEFAGIPELGHHLGFVVTHGNRSKEFQALLNGIAIAKTKHEEDKIIKNELVTLKEHLGSSKLPTKQIRELLIRLIYCEMLGHDTSFGYINAIKYAEQPTLLEKKTGYLAACVLLNRNHSLVCLLINTIQKDLKSTNVVAKSTVLNVICNLVDIEKMPPLLPFIVEALSDKRVEIRKKALITLKHVHQLSEDFLTNIDEQLRSAISDRDPIVVSAALQFFHTLVKNNASKYRGYLKVFLQILDQVQDGKLAEFNFHGVQAPWIQIKLLKILALLGYQNKSCSESMNATLLNMMKRLPVDSNIGCAVMFECIQTVTRIYPLKPLLDRAAKKTTLFLISKASNLKCSGITAMTSLVELNTSYAGDEKLQQIIIKCLDDEDRTVGKKILELMYKITNSENICVICERLLEYIRSTTEQSIKNDVAKNLSQLANQYAPSITWYVDTINDVIQAVDSPVTSDVMHGLFKVIATGENEEQRIIANRYFDLIKRRTLRENLVEIACWVLGEYGILLQEEISLDIVFSHLEALLEQKFQDTTKYGWIVSAMAKLLRHIGVYRLEVRRIMDRYRTGSPAELRQRCHEINTLASDMSLMEKAFPPVSSEEDIKVCSSLSFLDNYVANALSAGAQPYQQNMSNIEENLETRKAPQELRFAPYEDPLTQSTLSENEAAKHLKEKPSPVQTYSDDATMLQDEISVSLKKTPPKAVAVWGPAGYSGNKIKKTSEGVEKLAKSSSGHSSPGERSVNPRTTLQNPENTIAKIFKEVKSSDPFTSPDANLEQSPKISLFAGIKPKSKRETPKKVKKAMNSEQASSSDGLPDIVSEGSLEQRVAKKLHLEEDKLEPSIDVGQAKLSQELDERINEFHEKSTSSEDDINDLFVSAGNDSIQEGLRPQSVKNDPLTKEGSLLVDIGNTVSMAVGNSQMSNDYNVVGFADVQGSEGGSIAKQDSLLDVEVGIGDADHLVEDTSLMGQRGSASRKGGESTELCIDSNMRLVTAPVLNQSELVMVMKLTNHNQSRVAVEGISLKIEPPSNLVADSSSTEIAMEKLSFLETVTREVSLTYLYPAQRMSFKGTLRYSVSKNSKVLNFEHELPARLLFRPLGMTTEEFGEKWTSMSCDLRKHNMRGGCDEVAEVVAKYINFQVVDMKGSETILAGSILGNDLCLLHLNAQGAEIELWVKSPNKRLSEMVMKECLAACEVIDKTA